MFSVGEKVVMNGQTGTILNWYYDEGNVWVVDFGNGRILDCNDSELNVFQPCRSIPKRSTHRGSAGRNYYGELRRFRGYRGPLQRG